VGLLDLHELFSVQWHVWVEQIFGAKSHWRDPVLRMMHSCEVVAKGNFTHPLNIKGGRGGGNANAGKQVCSKRRWRTLLLAVCVIAFMLCAC
jgi:hypothetical protein